MKWVFFFVSIYMSMVFAHFLYFFVLNASCCLDIIKYLNYLHINWYKLQWSLIKITACNTMNTHILWIYFFSFVAVVINESFLYSIIILFFVVIFSSECVWIFVSVLDKTFFFVIYCAVCVCVSIQRFKLELLSLCRCVIS